MGLRCRAGAARPRVQSMDEGSWCVRLTTLVRAIPDFDGVSRFGVCDRVSRLGVEYVNGTVLFKMVCAGGINSAGIPY